MAQSVERLTLGFGSGPDLTVRRMEPHVRLCADSLEPACNDTLSLSFCAAPLLRLTHCLKINT